jgi:hypothetical protein
MCAEKSAGVRDGTEAFAFTETLGAHRAPYEIGPREIGA